MFQLKIRSCTSEFRLQKLWVAGDADDRIVWKRHRHDLWVHVLFWKKLKWWLDALRLLPLWLFPFDFLISDISSYIWKHTKTSTLSFHHTSFLVWAVQNLNIHTLRPPCLFRLHFYPDTRGLNLKSRTFLTDWTKKEKSMRKKINVSRFPPVWTATRRNQSRPSKDLTFCISVKPNLCLLFFILFNFLNILLSISSTYLIFSFIWRLSIIQNRNILPPILEYFTNIFLQLNVHVVLYMVNRVNISREIWQIFKSHRI